ncbi:sugar ABC transporter permease [Brucepastera parasyntrophica]|uniref:sugar ABC transporter permease n=1 Tax=Brucepastera parasyntrophica TaxID=2880008 RepID=UPI00210A599C|nr:sugar ABC transporter permease [Brucepastera parasyntrophica]ULQ60856.1 sugar ABC transporter permease [Brucepastera parasyntrophica]
MNIKMLKQNAREYGMYIALLVIMVLFTILSGGVFMSPRNLSNLFDQTGYVAVLAVGMTLILIIRHIDLSVGFVAGFIGAIAAVLMRMGNVPLVFVFIIAIAVGIVIGLYHGWLVAFMGVPAFVVSLASMFIFRGALLRLTEGSGTIIVTNKFFNALGNGFIPDIFNISGTHVLTLIIGVVAIIAFIINEIRTREKRKKYNFETSTLDMFIGKLVFISLLILFFAWQLAQYRGISWTVVIVIVIVAIYHFFMNNTVLGRHIYAIGGNPEAAELSGIKVKAVTMFVFASMSALAALAGILYTARLQSATTTAGNGFELDAIASAYVGGVSASGGVGKVTGTIIGAIVMSSLSNGMNLLGVGISYQYIVRGLVLVIAVLFDVRSRRVKI